MKQGLKYRFFHYEIFVLLTVVLTVIAIHVVDGTRLYPESLKARYAIVESDVSNVSDCVEIQISQTFDIITYYSIRYSSYLYNPDSVYRFCEMLDADLEGVDAVAVVPSVSLYKGRDYFIPVFSRYISQHAFNGLGRPNIDYLYDTYHWDQIHLLKEDELSFISDPISINVNSQFRHIILLCFPVLGTNRNVEAYVVAALSLDSLLSKVKSMGTFENGEAYMVTETGKFVLHPDNTMIGKDVGNFFLNKFGKNVQQIIDSASADILKLHSITENGNVMYAKGNVTDSWVVFFSVPYYDVVYPIFSDIVFISIVAIIAIVIIVLVCVYNIKKASDHRAKQMAIERDLEIAASIQKTILNLHSIDIPSLDVDVRHRSAKTVGGDVYYCNQYGDNMLTICVGDVSGKGVPAALLMGGVVLMLRMFDKQGKSPAEMCSLMNAQLCENNPNFNFVTLFLAVLDTETGRLRYCNAGHNEPICNSKYLHTSENMPLGSDPSQIFTEGEMILEDGSSLILYTDGVTEAMGPNSEEFGDQRFLSSVKSASNLSAREINSHIIEDVLKFADGNEQSDDFTLLTLRFSSK